MKAWPPQPGLTVMQRTTSAIAAQLGDRLDRGAGVDRDPGQAAELADRRRVRLACGVASAWKVIESAPALANSSIWRSGRLDHQVHVDRAAGGVDLVGDRAEDQRPDRDRRHEMAVHHVEVDHPRAGVHHLVDLRAEPREVGREDRRARPAALRSARCIRSLMGVSLVERERDGASRWLCSIEAPQDWHCMSSVLLIRAIVWCSPQLGHWETSSKRLRQLTQRRRPGQLGRAQPGLAAVRAGRAPQAAARRSVGRRSADRSSLNHPLASGGR